MTAGSARACVSRARAFKYPHATQKQIYQDMSISVYVRESVDTDGRRDARSSPPLVCRLRAVPCARQSRSMAAQLGAPDSGYCLRTSALGSARHGQSVIMQSAHAKAKRRRVIAHRWISRTARWRRDALRRWPPFRRLSRGELGSLPTRSHNS